MEPMTLGSPVNSPPHHGYQQHQGQQYPYSQVSEFLIHTSSVLKSKRVNGVNAWDIPPKTRQKYAFMDVK